MKALSIDAISFITGRSEEPEIRRKLMVKAEKYLTLSLKLAPPKWAERLLINNTLGQVREFLGQ